MPRQPKRAKSFAFDLLADWSAVASPLGPDDIHRGWVLHGTATLNGVIQGGTENAWRPALRVPPLNGGQRVALKHHVYLGHALQAYLIV